MQSTDANKRNLKLYALTYTQANNKDEKHGTPLPLCLDNYLKERKEDKGWKTKENNLTRLGAGYTYAKASIQTGQMEHQPLYHNFKTQPVKMDTVKTRKSLSNSWDHNLKNTR